LTGGDGFIIDGHTVVWHPSPNYNSRPSGGSIGVVILHSTGDPANASVGGAISWLTNPASKVSSHFVVDRAGKIWQLVSCAKRAWHAGVSEFRGRQDVNDFSVGIEQEHLDGVEDWPEVQVRATGLLVARIRHKYGDTMPIASNAAVAPSEGKVDPRGYPWHLFSKYVKMGQANPALIGLPAEG
jgi:N-acetyl-anhydromuramyl-L-alanine amidase AmpD